MSAVFKALHRFFRKQHPSSASVTTRPASPPTTVPQPSLSSLSLRAPPQPPMPAKVPMAGCLLPLYFFSGDGGRPLSGEDEKLSSRPPKGRQVSLSSQDWERERTNEEQAKAVGRSFVGRLGSTCCRQSGATGGRPSSLQICLRASA